jgi:type I restriction enzyme R subunit
MLVRFGCLFITITLSDRKQYHCPNAGLAIFDLKEKLDAAHIYTGHEVDQFSEAFFVKSKSHAAIANICKPAVKRWQKRCNLAIEAFNQARDMFEQVKSFNDPVVTANVENSLKDCKKAKDELEIFKKDLGTFVRFYEFMSQIVDYDDRALEKLSLYARHLRPMLREAYIEEDEIDLSNVELSHYRLTAIKQQHIKL